MMILCGRYGWMAVWLGCAPIAGRARRGNKHIKIPLCLSSVCALDHHARVDVACRVLPRIRATTYAPKRRVCVKRFAARVSFHRTERKPQLSAERLRVRGRLDG